MCIEEDDMLEKIDAGVEDMLDDMRMSRDQEYIDQERPEQEEE